MLTKVAQFTGILDLGLNLNTGVPSVTRDADTARVQSFIDWYEKEYYAKAYGRDMAARICAVINDWSIDDDEAKDILDKLGTFEPTPMACYIYFKFLEMGQFHASPTGVDTASDTSLQNPRWLQMRAWNVMADEHAAMVNAGIYVNPAMVEHLNGFGI